MTIKSIIKYSFFLLIFAFTIVSCEDEIDINVEPLTEQLVVDAWLTNQAGSQTISLSMTQPYFDNNLPEGLSGATVMVTSSTGTVFEFLEAEKGQYVWTPAANETLGEVGTDYGLQITLDGEDYGSLSTMNRVPPIDSITYEFRDDETFGPDGIYAEFFARDPIGGGDTYWVKTFKNGVFLNKPGEINLAFDAGFSEGGSVDGLIFITPIRESINREPDPDTEDDGDVAPWAVGDEIRVELHAINNDAFYFLVTAQRQITNGNNGIFSEPVINTTGNIFREDGEQVLGMFNVAAVSEMAVEIE
ncbi:MAG: hypothetical protein ACI9XO_004662 [Paraglaciecola sp.]|jgi:hypothetical protein